MIDYVKKNFDFIWGQNSGRASKLTINFFSGKMFGIPQSEPVKLHLVKTTMTNLGSQKAGMILKVTSSIQPPLHIT